MDHSGHEGSGGGFLRGRSGLVLLGFLAIGAFFLLSEHRAHLVGTFPLLLLLFLCPLMHVFMHGGHGGGGDGTSDVDRTSGSAGSEPHRH